MRPMPPSQSSLARLVMSTVLDDVGQGAWHCTVRLVYGVLHGLVLPVWRGDEIQAPPGALTPRRGRCRNRLG